MSHRRFCKGKRGVQDKDKLVEDIYGMCVQNAIIVCAAAKNNQQLKCIPFLPSSIEIINLQSVLEQLLQDFDEYKIYEWARQIPILFKQHFSGYFEQMWQISKEQFYQYLLANLEFHNQTLKNELQRLINVSSKEQNINQSRLSYQRYFYDIGASKIQEKLPESFIEQDAAWTESFYNQQNVTQKQNINYNIINASLIQNESELDSRGINRKRLSEDIEQDKDFLPLFIGHNGSIHLKAELSKMDLTKKQLPTRNQFINSSKIQNSSIVMPETVFINRMSLNSKAEISDLVRFYRQFSNTLQQFFHSGTLISSPFKHFLFCLEYKISKKGIKSNYNKIIAYQMLKSKAKSLLWQQSPEGLQFRRRRHYNNNILLEQIAAFCLSYTNFLWKYLQLHEISESKLGKLINTDTVYGIVLKNVWKFVEFLSERGFEYEQLKLGEILSKQQNSTKSRVSGKDKVYLVSVLETLKGEKNPQKYLKKVVIFYREVSKFCQTADELLNIYEEVLLHGVEMGLAYQIGLFRMKHIIEKLLRVGETQSHAGQISYSWTTWSVIVQTLKTKVLLVKYGLEPIRQRSQQPRQKSVECEQIMVDYDSTKE